MTTIPRSTWPRVRDRLGRIAPHRLLLAVLGVACVGLAALGVFVPGLPTTVFLIAATYLFAKSCPWLEQRLIRNRLFAPFLAYVDGTAPMPRRAKLWAAATMWCFVLVSVVLLGYGVGAAAWVLAMPPLAAVVGTWYIARIDAPARVSTSSSVPPRP